MFLKLHLNRGTCEVQFNFLSIQFSLILGKILLSIFFREKVMFPFVFNVQLIHLLIDIQVKPQV